MYAGFPTLEVLLSAAALAMCIDIAVSHPDCIFEIGLFLL
jgi:hypothetical protein